MKQLISIKQLASSNQINLLWEKKKSQDDITSFSYNIEKKRGLISKLRELVSFNVLDKMLRYDYKYEHAYFKETEAFKTKEGYTKFIAKTIDTRFDFVFNDLEAKHFNGFKTFITFNTKVYKFIKSYEKVKPLQKINLFTKRIEGLYPKQKEFYNLTGGNKNYHTIEIMTDVTTKNSTFSNIFTCFTYLKKHVITLLSQVDHLRYKSLFQTIFVNISYSRNKITVFLNGFKAILKKRKLRIKYYVPPTMFKTLKPIRTRGIRYKVLKLHKKFLKSHLYI